MLNSLDLKVAEIVQKNVTYPIEIFDLKIRSKSSHSFIEIVLDNLKHPTGSVTISECERVSRSVSSELDELGDDFNYTLHVGSAGAERNLRIPQDIERFVGQRVRIFYLNSEGKTEDGEFFIEKVEDGFCLFRKVKNKKQMKTNKETDFIKIEISKIKKGNLALNI